MRRYLIVLVLLYAPIAVAGTTVPFILVANHIYFRVSVNDNPSSSFLLDTGAGSSVIDRDHAAKLKLSLTGHGEAHGSGEKTVEIKLVALPEISFGDEDFRLHFLAAIPLSDIALRDGRPMQGILGFDVLSRYTVTVDYAHRTLRFDDPQQFKAPPNAVALPLHFVKNTPVVRGVVTMSGGQRFAIDMMVDTGARGAIRLNTPFVEQHQLENTLTNRLRGSVGIGVGGTTIDTIGRVASVELAGIVVKTPVASFATAKAGTDAETAFQAQLGGEILRRFTVVIDYPRQRFLLTPNAAFDEPYDYDMSGMVLAFADTAFKHLVVKSVLPSTPATEAGIAQDDEIQSIDGRPIATMALNDLRLMLMHPGVHKLGILRRGKRMEIELTARRLI